MQLQILQFGEMLVPGLIRAIVGWLENAASDGEFSKLEWKQLAETILRIGMMSAATFYGISGLTGVHIDAITAGFSAVLFDFVYVRIKKLKK